MTLQKYVTEVLQVPVTRIGNKHIVEAIEIVLDTCEHKFYAQLCEATGRTTSQLENSLRDAKEKSLEYMDKSLKEQIFPTLMNKSTITNTEFVVRAAQSYKEAYENKEER